MIPTKWRGQSVWLVAREFKGNSNVACRSLSPSCCLGWSARRSDSYRINYLLLLPLTGMLPCLERQTSTILSARELLVDARWSPAFGAALASSLLRASVPFLVRADRLTLEHCFGEPSDKNNPWQKQSFGYLNLLHRQLRERERENIDPSQGNMLDEG